MRTDPLIRALGADPAVFRPVYRAHRLILSRPRLVRLRGRKEGSDFLLYLMAGVISLYAAALMLKTRQPVLGGGLALTLCCGFLLMIVFTDHAGALVHPGERLVLAAHPHDDRSLLLAKLAAVGRSLALLSVTLFAPAGVTAVFWWGPGSALAFLAGAAGAALAVAALGLLAAVFIFRVGGRKAMDRLMPWFQIGAQLGYLVPMAGNQLIEPDKFSSGARALLPWLLPTFWFTAPLELTAGAAGPAAWTRLALAAGSLGLLGVAGGSVAAGLGRRLLEPETRPAAAPARPVRRAAGRGLGALLARSEGLRLFRLLRVHLRSDWRTRAEVFSLPILAVFLLAQVAHSNFPGAALSAPFLYGWMLFLSASTLVRSARPESLWWLLSSPIDRTRFSMATIPLLRLLMLLPLSIAFAFVGLRGTGDEGGSWPLEILSGLAFLVYGDLFLVLSKVAFADFPFSRAWSDAMGSSRRTAKSLLGLPVSGVGMAAILLCQHFGAPGIAGGGLAALVLHWPATFWARQRARRAAERLDLASIG